MIVKKSGGGEAESENREANFENEEAVHEGPMGFRFYLYFCSDLSLEICMTFDGHLANEIMVSWL